MIFVIGIGIEGRESLSRRAAYIASRAGLIVGGVRQLAEFADAGGRRYALGSLEGAAREIEAAVKRSEKVVVLATGDPLLFGIGAYIIKRFGKRRVEIIPNVSTVQEAFSRIKVDMNGLRVLSVHGRESDYGAIYESVRTAPRCAILTDKENTPGRIAKELLRRGTLDCRAFVCESLGTASERVREGTLKQVASMKAAPQNILVLVSNGAQAGIDAARPFGLEDSSFSHSNGMITKEEFRAVALSKLAIRPSDIVWDIGACSGSVAIEAARLTRGGVYAVERDPKRLKDMRENLRRFPCPNLSVIPGEAPAALKGLPAPDAVFVGGGGAGLSGILSYAAKRLAPGGRAVVNAVTMESAARAFEFFRKKGWEKELVLVSVSRARLAGPLHMLSANNPVFVIRGRRPE